MLSKPYSKFKLAAEILRQILNILSVVKISDSEPYATAFSIAFIMV